MNTVSKRYNNDAEVIPLIQKDSRQPKIYWRELDKLALQQNLHPTRFLFLHLMNYKGWALFCDSDIVFLEDVDNHLFLQMIVKQ